MKRVVITLDDEVARWARTRAAEENTSVSRFVGQLLQQHMRDDGAYRAAMEQFLSSKPTALRRKGKYPSRGELYGRSRVR